MHAVEFDLAGKLGGPHRGGIGPVGAEKLRVEPSGAQPEQLVAEAEPAQHADAVRLERDAGADLGQGGGLLVDTHIDPALKQRVGGGDAANAAADDHDIK